MSWMDELFSFLDPYKSKQGGELNHGRTNTPKLQTTAGSSYTAFRDERASWRAQNAPQPTNMTDGGGFGAPAHVYMDAPSGNQDSPVVSTDSLQRSSTGSIVLSRSFGEAGKSPPQRDPRGIGLESSGFAVTGKSQMRDWSSPQLEFTSHSDGGADISPRASSIGRFVPYNQIDQSCTLPGASRNLLIGAPMRAYTSSQNLSLSPNVQNMTDSSYKRDLDAVASSHSQTPSPRYTSSYVSSPLVKTPPPRDATANIPSPSVRISTSRDWGSPGGSLCARSAQHSVPERRYISSSPGAEQKGHSPSWYRPRTYDLETKQEYPLQTQASDGIDARHSSSHDNENISPGWCTPRTYELSSGKDYGDTGTSELHISYSNTRPSGLIRPQTQSREQRSASPAAYVITKSVSPPGGYGSSNVVYGSSSHVRSQASSSASEESRSARGYGAASASQTQHKSCIIKSSSGRVADSGRHDDQRCQPQDVPQNGLNKAQRVTCKDARGDQNDDEHAAFAESSDQAQSVLHHNDQGEEDDDSYDSHPSAPYNDEGVLYHDDGALYNDDGVPYNDGDVPYNDEGVLYNDEGVLYHDDGVLYKNDGVPYNDEDVLYSDEGVPYNDQGTPCNEEGVPFTDRVVLCKDGGVPCNGEVVPYNDGGVLYNDGGVPYNDGGVLYNDEGVPYECEGIPCKGGCVLYNDEGVPCNVEGVSNNDEGVPYNDQGVPCKDGCVPYNDEGVPCNDEGVSKNGQGVPYNDQGVSKNVKGLPYDDEGVPCNDEGVSNDGQGVLYDDGGEPCNEEGLPYNEEGVLKNGKGLPYDDGGVPRIDEGVSNDGEGVPFDDGGEPCKEKGVPYNDERVSNNGQGVP